MPSSTTRLTLSGLLTLVSLAIGCGGPEPSPGETREAPHEDSNTEGVDQEELERLQALGYVAVGKPLLPGARTGVLSYDRPRVQDGLNLFTNWGLCSAQLMDMEGRVLHFWGADAECFRWDNAILLPDGDLLVVGRAHSEWNFEAIRGARYLQRMAWDGSVRWRRQLPAHHDVELTPTGQILALGYSPRKMADIHPSLPVRDHWVVRLSNEGEILEEEVSFRDVLSSAPELFTLKPIKPRRFEGHEEVDPFHSNSIESMRHGHLFDRHPIYAPGNLLFCLRNQDLLAIADWNTKKLLWAWGPGELSRPHDATILPDGNILVFDNGLGRGWSRVVEVDPIAGKIVWEYRAPEPTSFYSPTRGGNQRLRNGNTLITESDSGRVFEVTHDGEVVWEFLNHNVNKERRPSVIARMRRFEGLDYSQLLKSVELGRVPRID